MKQLNVAEYAAAAGILVVTKQPIFMRGVRVNCRCV